MQECVSTSKFRISLVLLAALIAGPAFAQMSPPPTAGDPGAMGAPPPAADPGAAPPGSGGMLDRAAVPEEDDFTRTPYTEYGEFNDDDDEAEQARFFAHGRLFGISLGSGAMGASGNRGAVYQGGFPTLDLKVHYWFDFNTALDFGVSQTTFFYTGGKSSGRTDVNIFNLYIDIKYYFTTTNISAGISFANPYVLVGFGSYTKRELNSSNLVYDQPDTKISPVIGAGLEFALRPKKLYLGFEGKISFPHFNDYTTSNFSATVPDLSGLFWSLGGTLLFVW